MQLPKFDIRFIAIIIFFSTLFFPYLVVSQELNITTDKKFYSINETALISINGTLNTNFTLIVLYPDNSSTILMDSLNCEGEYNYGLGLTEYGNYSAKLNSTNFTHSIMFFVLSSEEDQGISIPQPGPSEFESNSTGEDEVNETIATDNQTTTTTESNFTDETDQTQEFNETINTSTSTTIVTTTTEKVTSTEIQTTVTKTEKLTTSSVTTTQTNEQETTTTSKVTATQTTEGELTTTTTSTTFTSTTTTIQENLEAQVALEINDEVKDNENKTVGKKIKDEPDYETYILSVDKEGEDFVIIFYHDSDTELPIWVEGDVNYTLSQNVSSANENVTLNVDLVEGEIPYFKLHVGKESEVFEFGIRILNIQSYPLVGGEWKVEFETWGEGKLKIENLNYSDVTFNSLYHDSVLVDVDIDENNTIETEWSYLIGEVVYDVHKKGRHILKFTFGNVEYAYNLAGDTWWNHTWRYRTEIRVNNSFNRTNGLITYGMNFTDIIINELGYSGKTFDNNSVRVVEWNSTEGTNTELPSIFQNTSTFDNQTNANGTVYWVMDNITAPGVNRTFYIYFDTADGGTKQPPNYTDTMHAKLKLLSAEEYVTLSGSGCLLYYVHSYKNGTFASQQLIEDHSASNCWGLGIGDFDNDGDYDVVMGAGNGNVYYYEYNEDDGDFSASGTNIGSFIEASSYGMDIATSDFNNDGNLDFVISGNSDGYTLFTGYGNGSFTSSTITTDGPGSNGRGKDDGDFNEDGCMDFISGTNEVNFYFWEGNCDGTFETPVIAGTMPSGYDSQYGMASGDFDGDGHYDLWVDGRNTGVWWFVKGNGDGTFQEETQLADFADYWNPGDAFDYDHDGNLDLVRTDYNNRYGYYHEGYGNSSFKTSGFTTIATQADTNRMGIAAPTKHYEYPLNITRSSAEVGASINILDESNYPSLQVYTKGDKVQIRVNETEGQSETTSVNITLTFSDSSTKTYEMANGTDGSVDLWEYNYTVLSSDPEGQLNLTATAYDNSGLELTTNDVSGFYLISTLNIVNSSGYVSYSTYSFSSGNSEESITFSDASSNNSVRLKVPTEADVSYSVLNITGSTATGSSGWWDISWRYRKSLTFDNSGQDEDMINFTSLVKLNSSNFDYSRVSSQDELRFIDNDNSTVLNHHVELWNISGNSYIWVKVPQIDAGSSSDYIWIYYGNSGASNNENETGTYDNNFVMVHHLNETSGTHYDSTIYGNNGTQNGNLDQEVTGKVDGADNFDGTDDYINVSDSNSLDMGKNNFLLSTWILPNNATDGSGSILEKKNSTGVGFELSFVDGMNEILSQDSSGGQDVSGGVPIDFDAETRKDDIYTHDNSNNPSRVQIDKTGWYRVSYASSFLNYEIGTTNVRNIREIRLRKNGDTNITPSATMSYARGYVSSSDDVGDQAGSSGTVILSLESGDYLELVSERIDGPDADSILIVNESWILAEEVTEKVVQVYDTNGGQDVADGTIAINFNAQTRVDSIYSHNTGSNPSRVYVNKTGWYKVSYACNYESTSSSGSERHIVANWLRKNGDTTINPSKTRNYNRADQDYASGEGAMNSNEGTSLVYLEDGDYIELMSAMDHGEGVDTVTLANKNWMLIEKVDDYIIQVYDSDGGLDISGGATAVQFGSQTKADKIYTHNTGSNPSRVYVNETGWYRISYTSGFHQASLESAREIYRTWLKKNGNTEIVPSANRAYLRGISNGDDESTHATTITHLNEGDYVELFIQRVNGTDCDAQTLANENWLIIEKIRNSTNSLIRGSFDDGTGGEYIETPLSEQKWYFVTYDVNRTNSSHRLFLDGIDMVSDSYTKIESLSNLFPLKMGTNRFEEFFNGTIDEVQVSNTSRTADWINTSYLSMSDQFITYGSEEEAQYPTNVTLDVGTQYQSYEWNQTGELTNTNITSDFSSAIDSYLTTCEDDGDGFCDQNIPLNISSASAGKVSLNALDLRYETDESSVFSVIDWWMNDTGFTASTLIDKANYYKNTSTKPSVDLDITGFKIDNSSTSCEIDDSSKIILYQNGNAYCPLDTIKMIDHTSGGTWGNYRVGSSVLANGYPVKKSVETTQLDNIALSTNGGTALSVSSEMSSYEKENAIDGTVGDSAGESWKSNSTDTNPWIKIQFNDTYYISHIKWANRVGKAIENLTLQFSDGYNQTITLQNNGDLNQYNLSEKVWTSWINFSTDTTYHGAGYAGAKEIEVYGTKGDQVTETGNIVKKFNITGYLPNGTVSPDTGDYRFYNITTEVDAYDTLFTAGTEALKWYNGTDWIELNITNQCANLVSETENNYASKTIGSDVWYSCYNDTDGDGVKDYFKILIPHLSNQQFKVSALSNNAAINILDEEDYPQVNPYKKGDIINIRVNETSNQDYMNIVNITLTFSDSSTKTYEMANGTDGSVDLWEYNYTVQLGDSPGNLSLTARGYSSNNIQLTENTLSGIYISDTLNTMNSTGFVISSTDMFSTNNVIEDINFSSPVSNQTIRLRLPKNAVVTSCYLNITGMDNTGGGGGEENTWTQTSKSNFDIGNKTNVTTVGDILYPVESGDVELTNNVIFAEDFAGSTINETRFDYGGGTVTQNENITLLNDANGWDNYLNTNDDWTIVADRTFQARATGMSGARMMIGWKDTGAGVSYTDMPYAIYFSNGNFYIYEDGSSRGDTGEDYTLGTMYDVKVVLKATGATYYYKETASSTWTQLYDSTHDSGQSDLKPHIVHYDDTAGEYSVTDNWQIYDGSDFAYNTEGLLESKSFKANMTANWGNITWSENISDGTNVTFQVTTSDDNSTWSSWSDVFVNNNSELTGVSDSLYIKWRANLTTTNTSNTPTLEEVNISYTMGQFPSNVSLNINGGEEEWNQTGKFKITNKTSDLSPSINSYLSSCVQDINGFCDGDVSINITVQDSGIVRLDNLTLKYETDESSNILGKDWWMNDTGFTNDIVIDKATYYSNISAPSFDLELAGFLINNSSTSCEIDDSSKTILYQNGNAYCSLDNIETFDKSGNGTWANHSVNTNILSIGKPVKKIVELTETENIALSTNGGTVISASSELYSKENAIDGVVGNETDDAWSSISTDTDPWIKIQFNDTYYISHIKWANMPTNSIENMTLYFNDGSSQNLTLEDNTDLNQYNLSENIWASSINFSVDTTYEGGGYSGAQEIEVYGEKGDQHTSGLVEYKLFNITGYFPNGSVSPDTGDYKFYNITAEIDVSDGNFISKAEKLRWYNGSDWVDLNITNKCANSVSETEKNYSSKTIGSDIWYSCYNDTDSNSLKDYFKILVPHLSNQQFKIESNDTENPVVVNTGINPTTLNVNNNITIEANVTDNADISRVWAVITKPNSDEENITLTHASGDTYDKVYRINMTGNYDISIYANDTFNNINSTSAGSVTSNFVINQPKTYNTSIDENTTFEVGDTVVVRVNVTDPEQSYDIDKVLINLTNPEPEIKIQNTEMSLQLTTGDQKTYEYNFTTMENLTLSLGEWQINISANDTGSNLGVNSTTFTVQDTTKPQIISKSVSPSSIIVNNNITLEANITDNTNISSVWVLVTKPNSDEENVTLANPLGDIYNTSYKLSMSGTYNATIYVNDTSNNLNSSWIDTFDSNLLIKIPKTYNTTIDEVTTFELGDDVIVKVNVTKPDEEYIIDSVLINITNNQSVNKVENVNMTYLSNISDQWLYETNLTSMLYETASVGTWNISVFTNDTNQQSATNTTTFLVEDTKPPFFDNTSITPSDLGMNDNVTIQVDVVDIISKVWVNITKPDGSPENVSLDLVSGNTYQTTYNASESDLYNLTVFANDTSNQVNDSWMGTFRTYGNTTGLVLEQPQYFVLSNVTQDYAFTFRLNLTLRNTGNATANNAKIDTELLSGWVREPDESRECGSISAGEICTKYYNITVPATISDSNYTINGTGKWKNLDDTKSFTRNNTVVNVTRNPILNITNNSFTSSIQHGTSEDLGYFDINSTGNYKIGAIEINKISGNLTDSWVGFLETSINSVSAGENKSVTINVTVPMGYDQGVYESEYLVNATTSTCSPLDSCWKYLNITVTVPENTSWTLNPENITEDVYVNTSGSLTNLTIINIGNIQMKFNITEDDFNTTTMLDISNINETITLEDQTLSNYSHNITSNYTIPINKQPGSYNTIVSITNSSLEPTQRNVTIILNVIDNILPTIENTSLNDTLLDVNYQSLNITADVTDNINVSKVWARILFPNETDQNITMTSHSGNTYSLNYTPTTDGIHNITIFVNDTSNNIQSSWLDEFNAVATTTGPMYQLPTYIDAEINTQISVNLTLNNTGNATMYDANLTIILEQYGFVADDTETYNCGNIEPNSSCNYNFTVNITDEAAAFTHWVYGNGTWKNPNNTLNNIQNETELYIQLPPASLNILENAITNSIDEGVTGEAGNFTIRASGNNLNGITINVSDDGNISSDWVTFSPRSYIPLLLAETNEVIDVNVSVPTGQDGGNYQTNVTANATGSVCSPSSNCWDNVLLNITVPTDYSWNRTPDTYNLTVLKGTYDNFVIRLVNQGNMNMSLKVRATVYPDCTNHTPDSDCTYLSTYTEEVDIGKQEDFNNTFYYSTPYIGNTIMDIKIYRADDSSDVKHTWIYMNVIEPPPTIENVTASPSVLDINHGTVNISAYVSDNIQVDKVWVNITNNGSESFPMSLRSGDVYSGGWWEKIYTPSSSGTHSIVVYANDTTNSLNESSEHSFNVITNTSLLIEKSPTTKTVHGVTQTTNKSFELNLTLDNVRLGGAYSPNISFDLPSALVAEPSILYFNNITSGTSISNSTNITVINGTSLGYYEIGIYSNWTNPDNTLGQNSTTLGVTVESSPVIEIKNSSLSLELDDGQSTSRNIILESTGNSPANDIQVNCTGAKCSAFNVTLDPNTISSLTPPNTREINLSLSIPRGTVATTYFMNIISNITGSPSGISDEMPFIVTVPENKTWSVSPSSFSTTVGLGISGVVGALTLENSGNTLLDFNLTVNGNISDHISLDSSTLSLEASVSETINVEYNSSELGNYLGNITIDSTGTTPQRNVSVNLTVISFGVDVLNPTSSNITTLTPGDALEIHVNASEHGELINQGVSWDADVQENTCLVTSSSFDYNNNYWIVNCTTPIGIDSGLKDMRVYGTYDLVTVSDLEMDSVNYTDVNPPSFVSIIANPVNRSQEATIIANITDDIRVDTVLLEIEYLNSTKINTTMDNVSNLWTSTITGTSLVGDYDFVIYANDTSGNYNTDNGWFEVRSNTTYKFNGTISDPAGTVWGTDFVFKRPDNNDQILNFSTNATTGYYEKEIHPRTYDIEINTSNSTIELNDANINQDNLDSLDAYGFDTDSVTLNPSAYTPYVGIFFDTNISFENATLTFNYPSSVSSESLIAIYKCEDWSFDINGTPNCLDYSWARLNDTVVDSVNNKVSINLTNFSAYIASKFVCGNGECESDYGESNSVCSSDCPTSNVTGGTGTGTGMVGGGGGGGGGLSEEELEKALEKIEPSPIQPSTDLIEITLHPGEYQIASIGVTNNQDINTTVQLSAEGAIWDFIEFEDESIDLEKKSTKYTKVKFSTLENTIVGVYTGNILMIDKKNRTQKVGVILKVELERESLLDVKVETITKTVSPDNVLRFKVDVYNLGQTKKVDITNTYSIRDAETDELFSKKQETFAVETTVSYVKTMEIPEDLPLGKYVIEAVSLYDNKTASSIDTFEVVKQPLVFRILYSIASSWITYVILFIIIPGVYFGNKFYKKWKEKKEKERKYVFPVDFKKLPKAGERSILVGKVAETNVNAYINMDKLQVHMLAAGATGSGKSVSSQIIAEELLKKGLPVIVFDPTFQWSGFARQSKDKRMLSLYSKFGMKPTDARSFKTNIIVVDNPEMKLNIQEHIKPGEITVFGLQKLNSSELDKFVRNTIDSFFEVDWPASQKLKLLVVFDEVHRLLPKYGGKGGYVSLEKGAREFRKWGIGLIMISQVLLDFRAAIRTNVGTEVLLRTKYSGDINRVRKEYGEEYSKTLPKLTIGTSLVHNPEYNDGKPYFISFRPLLHQTSEISDQEMEQIINSEKRLEEIEAKISELRERKVDTYDMEVEVKLAKEKMKEGQMRMAGLYLESVENKIKTIEKKS